MNITNNLVDLPKGPLGDIFGFLDPIEIEPFSLKNKRSHEVASSSSAWEAFANKINCPINGEIGNIDKQVRAFVISIKKNINKLPEKPYFFQFWKTFPRDIKKIISNPHAPTIKEVKILQEYRKARDTIVVWKAIAKAINMKVPKLELNSSEKVINKSKDFNVWCNTYQNKLFQIQKLNLSDKQLSSLPKEIGELPNLRWLFLANNQLSSLPPEIGNLSQLEWLKLEKNQLTTLPPEIGKLTQLQKLSLRYNQLSSLPKEIGKLIQLNWVDLSYNQLSSLPKEFMQLNQLLELYLLKNQLTFLPKEIGNLSLLKRLAIQNNQISSLPPRNRESVLAGMAPYFQQSAHLPTPRNRETVSAESTRP